MLATITNYINSKTGKGLSHEEEVEKRNQEYRKEEIADWSLSYEWVRVYGQLWKIPPLTSVAAEIEELNERCEGEMRADVQRYHPTISLAERQQIFAKGTPLDEFFERRNEPMEPIMDQVAERPEFHLRVLAGLSPHTSPEALTKLTKDEVYSVGAAACANPHTPAAALEAQFDLTICTEAMPNKMECMMINPNCPPRLITAALEAEDPGVVSCAQSRLGLPVMAGWIGPEF